MAICLIEPEIVPFDPPTPKTYPRTIHEVDRIIRCGDIYDHSKFDIYIYHEAVHLGPRIGGGDCIESSIVLFERAMLVFHRLSIATTALSRTIQLQFAIECLRRSNQRGASLWVKNLGVFPSVMLGLQRADTP